MFSQYKTLLGAVIVMSLSACGGGGEETTGVTQPVANKAPTISGAPVAAVEKQAFSFTPVASDPEGDALTFSISNKPAWLALNTATGAITGTPTAADIGTFNNITLSVSDGKLSASITFSLTVQAAPVLNAAPTLSGSPSAVIEEQMFSFTPTAADADGDRLTFSIKNKPAWLVFDAATGQLSGTPSLGTAARYEGITLEVSDGRLTASLALTINVTPAKRIALGSGAAVATATYWQQLDLKTLLSNEPNAEFSYRVEKLPTWASFDEKSLTISGTPAQQGLDDVALMVKNNQQTWLLQGTVDVKDSAQYLGNNALDFYSKAYDGSARVLRNDLTGDLAAEVQFVQSHSVAPNNNYNRNTADESQSRYMPRLVAQREALLLFIPNQDSGIQQVRAELTLNGEIVQTLDLKHPNLLPAADLDNGSSVAYSKRAWWVHIPWQQVKNGLEINFSAGEKKGKLAAAAIDIGDASQLVLKSIRLGMLTNPDQSQGHFTLRDPVLAATDYFQTVPTSKLVVASYADMTLDKVIVASGRIYDKSKDVSSSTSGDVYSGDMRENVAKAQVSTGINMADYGLTSNNMAQSYPHFYKQITNHHAWGQYINGRIQHGLSGGNGIGTLISSAGNEASHEWGHAYGLGHYPGQGLTTDGRWAVHHADSGWGYIAHRKRMRSNVVSLNTDGSMTFHKDAMSGGYSNSQFSTYTHHTGYSARVIQNNLETFPIADTSFATGYKKWNTQTGNYEAYVDKNNRPAPVSVGGAVATILGGYDPVNYSAVIYPVFHGNYGNVFDLPAPDLTSSADQCWVEVSNAENSIKRIKMAATRHNASTINQLHFNLAADFKPTLAVLSCQHNGVTTELTRTAFDGQIPQLPELAIVGQEHGFAQLKQREFAEIQQALAALPASTLLLPNSLATKVASYDLTELLAALEKDQAAKLSQMLAYRDASTSTSVLLRHAKAEGLAPSEVAARLRRHLQQTGLLESATLTLSGGEIYGNNVFFDGRNGENSTIALTPRASVDVAERTSWFKDAYGRLHLTQQPWLCATQVGNAINLLNCSVDNLSQRFESYNNNALVLKNVASGKCLDYDRTNVKLIPYSCHGGSNQQWNGMISQTPLWLALLSAEDIKQVIELLGN